MPAARCRGSPVPRPGAPGAPRGARRQRRAGAGGTEPGLGPQGAPCPAAPALTFEDRAELLQGHVPGGPAARGAGRRRGGGAHGPAGRRPRSEPIAATRRPPRGLRSGPAARHPRAPRRPQPPDGRRLRPPGAPSHRPARSRAARARGTAPERAPLQWRRARGARLI